MQCSSFFAVPLVNFYLTPEEGRLQGNLQVSTFLAVYCRVLFMESLLHSFTCGMLGI